MVTLGTYQRPSEPILDVVYNNLGKRIFASSQNGYGNEYDFAVIACLYLYGSKVYIRFETRHMKYVEALNQIKELHPYHDFTDKEDNKSKWDNIRCLYESSPCIMMPLNPSITDMQNSVSIENLKFTNCNDRAEKIAKRQLANILLNQYGCGQQVPAERMIEFYENAFQRMDDEEVKFQLNHIKKQIMNVLISISSELFLNEDKSEST